MKNFCKYLIVFFLVSIGNLSHADILEFRTNCTTKATGCDGTRSSCYSNPQEHTVPSGYVLVEKSLDVIHESRNGSAYSCDVSFRDWIEVVPGTGIKQPTTIWMRAHARSPKGHCAGRGWMHCLYKVKRVDLPNHPDEEINAFIKNTKEKTINVKPNIIK